MLDDRKPTVELIKREGEKIAESAEPTDKEKILKQLNLLDSRWDALLDKAETRYSKRFHSVCLGVQLAVLPHEAWKTFMSQAL